MSSLKEKIKDFMAVAIVWVMLKWEDIKDSIITVVVTFCACLILTNFFFKPVIVSGTSMYPTIHDGSVGFSSIISRGVKGINRFDIVVVYLEKRDDDLIKRVIGLPGETVSFRDDVLYINDQPVEQTFLDEEYVREMTSDGINQLFTNDFSYTLGQDEYFCMGDNRPRSADSRLYGPFHRNEILSIGLLVIYPFEQFGIK